MWLRLVAIVVILLAGIYLIAFLEEKLVSGPRRRELEKKAREKLKGNDKKE
ncbi:hypothetical protein GMSM_36720 [Geomonas sp. Red276]